LQYIVSSLSFAAVSPQPANAARLVDSPIFNHTHFTRWKFSGKIPALAETRQAEAVSSSTANFCLIFDQYGRGLLLSGPG